MKLLQKQKIGFFVYWLVNIANVIYQSKKNGLYPKRLQEQVYTLSLQQPYPVTEIIFASLLITFSILATYFFFTKTKNGAAYSAVFSLSLLLIQVLIIPSDAGGIQYAFAQYAVITLIFALLVSLITNISRWIRRS